MIIKLRYRNSSRLGRRRFRLVFGKQNNGVTNIIPHSLIKAAQTTNDETRENKQIAEELEKQIFSESSQNLMTKRAPMNTARNNSTALNRFATFCIDFYGMLGTTAGTVSAPPTESGNRCLRENATLLMYASHFQKIDGTMASNLAKKWSSYSLKRSDHALVEFVTHLKQNDGSKVMTSTLKTQSLGIQHGPTQ